MLCAFNFGQTTPAGLGLDIPDGPYRVLVKDVEDKDGQKGKNANFSLSIDPSEGQSGTVHKTLRYPRDANDEVNTFWAAFYGAANNLSDDQIRALNGQDDPKVSLVGKAVFVYIKKSTYQDEKTGQMKDGLEVRPISTKAYQEAKMAQGGGQQQQATGGFGGTQAITPGNGGGSGFAPTQGGFGGAQAGGGDVRSVMNQMMGQR